MRFNQAVRAEEGVRVEAEDESVGFEPRCEIKMTEMFPETDERGEVDPPDCSSSLITPDLHHH